MSKFLHLLLHGLAMFAASGSLLTGLVPMKYAPLVLAAQGTAQAIIGLTNHETGK